MQFSLTEVIAITIIAILMLIAMGAVAFSLYIWRKPRSYTREHFAFAALSAVTSLIAIATISTFIGAAPWQIIFSFFAKKLGFEYALKETTLTEYAFFVFLFVVFITFIVWVHSNWSGASTKQNGDQDSGDISERYYGSSDLVIFEDYLTDLLHFAGGRENELTQVQSWLANRDSGVVLIEGLSGYGKTTFIAQLKQRLKFANRQFVWHIFSRTLYDDSNQDQTRFDSNLAEQFALLLGEDVRKIENKSNFVTSILRDPPKNLILLIDALDETDARFLTYKLPKKLKNGLKIIVTARKIGNDLNINAAGLYRHNMSFVIEMKALTVNEIVGLLNKLNMPSENAEEIVRISKGDPFYVRFLLEDILNGNLSMQVLDAYPPSLDGYLEQQFSQLAEGAKLEIQAKLVSQIVLSPIPIPKEELVATISGLELINFDAHFKEVRRFFILTERGYVVCHNRFKDFFLRKMRG